MPGSPIYPKGPTFKGISVQNHAVTGIFQDAVAFVHNLPLIVFVSFFRVQSQGMYLSLIRKSLSTMYFYVNKESFAKSM